jgi:hypothetical protein
MWWFRPTCPLPADRRAWIDYRMSWLAAELGLERLKSAPVILPTGEFFPDRFDGSDGAIRALLDRVCGYMDIDPSTVELELYGENRGELLSSGYQVVKEEVGSAGQYMEEATKTIVAIEEHARQDPVALVAIMAHELGHAHLLGGGRISRDEPDHEPLTDLVSVYFGLGVLAANAVIRESQWSSGGWSGWSIGRQGYLTENDFAYALAVFARARLQSHPPWARYLRLNVRSGVRQSLRYFRRTGECRFDPGNPTPPAQMPVWTHARRLEDATGGADGLGGRPDALSPHSPQGFDLANERQTGLEDDGGFRETAELPGRGGEYEGDSTEEGKETSRLDARERQRGLRLASIIWAALHAGVFMLADYVWFNWGMVPLGIAVFLIVLALHQFLHGEKEV